VVVTISIGGKFEMEFVEAGMLGEVVDGGIEVSGGCVVGGCVVGGCVVVGGAVSGAEVGGWEEVCG